jgi:hypothetical protein
MKLLIFSALALGCALAIGCDEGDDGDPSETPEASNNNVNGYCWDQPADCAALRPLEDEQHYHCCYDSTGYYCTTDGTLHAVECDYACSYDAEQDLIYCAAGPDQGAGGETQPIPPGSHF